MSTCVICDMMCCIMWDYKCIVMWDYKCIVMWDYKCIVMWDYKCIVMYVHGHACTVCVIWWSQINIYMCDMILCYECVMIVYMQILGVLHDWNLYVVLNTMYSYIWCYVMWFGIYNVWLLWLYNAVMCVYVDNYVDNSLIYVDNFFVAFATLLRTFLKILYFRVFSHIISYYLLFALFISFFHHIAIISYIVYTI